MLKRIISIAMCLVLITGLVAVSFEDSKVDVRAASYEDINSSEVFLKQKKADTCTLCSSAMMIRRALIMKDSSNWKKVTESSVRSIAWSDDGLAWNFTSNGISVGHGSLSGTTSQKKEYLISLLNDHPEGIVLYFHGKKKMHAVLLAEYTDGVFYCADPAGSRAEGLIPLSQALYVTVSNANAYWYVKNTLPGLTDYLQTDVSLNIGGFLSSSASSDDSATKTAVMTFAETNKDLLPSSYKAEKVTGLKLASNKAGSLTVNWSKLEGVDGYKVQFTKISDFSKVRYRTCSASRNKIILSDNMTSGKRYYVRVCAYKKLASGAKVYYKYSKVKYITIK